MVSGEVGDLKTQIRLEMTVDIGCIDPTQYLKWLKQDLENGDGRIVLAAWRQDGFGLESKVFLSGAKAEDAA